MEKNIFKRIFNFGSNNVKSNAVSSEEAIKSLREAEDLLTKKQNYLEEEIQKQKATALSSHRQGNKRGAMLAMKKMKKYEKSLIEVDGTLTTIEIQRESLMNASAQTQVFKAIQSATTALKKTYQNMTPEDVNDYMDEAAEQNKIAEDIGRALSSFASNTVNDSDQMELENELELLMKNSEDVQLSKYETLPDVPNTSRKTKKNQVKNPSDELIADAS